MSSLWPGAQVLFGCWCIFFLSVAFVGWCASLRGDTAHSSTRTAQPAHSTACTAQQHTPGTHSMHSTAFTVQHAQHSMHSTACTAQHAQHSMHSTHRPHLARPEVVSHSRRAAATPCHAARTAPSSKLDPVTSDLPPLATGSRCCSTSWSGTKATPKRRLCSLRWSHTPRPSSVRPALIY